MDAQLRVCGLDVLRGPPVVGAPVDEGRGQELDAEQLPRGKMTALVIVPLDAAGRRDLLHLVALDRLGQHVEHSPILE
jgi:hypothetical protein